MSHIYFVDRNDPGKYLSGIYLSQYRSPGLGEDYYNAKQIFEKILFMFIIAIQINIDKILYGYH